MIAEAEKPRFFTLILIPETSASDFEEHLGHGLGKDAGDALKFMMWLEIVKMKTSSGKGKEIGREGLILYNIQCIMQLS